MWKLSVLGLICAICLLTGQAQAQEKGVLLPSPAYVTIKPALHKFASFSLCLLKVADQIRCVCACGSNTKVQELNVHSICSKSLLVSNRDLESQIDIH